MSAVSEPVSSDMEAGNSRKKQQESGVNILKKETSAPQKNKDVGRFVTSKSSHEISVNDETLTNLNQSRHFQGET